LSGRWPGQVMLGVRRMQRMLSRMQRNRASSADLELVHRCVVWERGSSVGGRWFHVHVSEVNSRGRKWLSVGEDY
jgi:hypothetical protein